MVQLNVVRSIRMILGVMSEIGDRSTPPDGLSHQDSPASDRDHQLLNPDLLKLKMRLAPLQQVEEALLRKLSPAGSGEYEATRLSPSNDLSYAVRSGKLRQELAVHSGSQWKGAFAKLMSTVRTSLDSVEVDFSADPNDPGVILNACCEDMIKLWSDPTLQGILRSHNVRLEDKSGLCVFLSFYLRRITFVLISAFSFLDSLERVTSLKYVPTDGELGIPLDSHFTHLVGQRTSCEHDSRRWVSLNIVLDSKILVSIPHMVIMRPRLGAEVLEL